MKGLTNSQNYISGTTINNENITITENGVYEPSEGYTGIGTATVNVPTVNNQDKTVTPKITQQTISADSGFSGLGTVTVNAVDSSIDSDIVASNIVKGVNILGVEGTAVELNGSTLSVTPTASAQNHTPTAPSNGFTSVSVEGDANLISENIVKNVSIFGVQGTYEGTPINNQDKTIIENGTYTADTGYTGLGTVTVEVPSSGGHEVTYTNLTNADIKKGDKLWINQTATTTTVADAQVEQVAYNFIQTPNPNIVVGRSKVFTLTDNTYVSSTNGPMPGTTSALRTDKFGNLITEDGMIYNFINGTYININKKYMGNGYIYKDSSTLQKYNTTTWELEKSYAGSASQLLYGWSFEDGYIISSRPYNGYARAVKLNDEDNTFTVKSLDFKSTVPLGQLTEQKIAFGLNGNVRTGTDLLAYKYSRTGDTLDDITFTSILSSEFPDDMRPFFTEAPAKIYWDEYSKILSGIWASPTKILIFKYENGEWVNKTPTINIDLSSTTPSNLHLSTSSDLSKILISWSDNLNGKYNRIYDGNETSSGYYAVPYLYSRKESLVGKAQSDVAINQTGKAATISMVENSAYQGKLILKAVVEGGTPEEESKALEQAQTVLEKI